MLDFIRNIEFANPAYLYLLLIIPLLIIWYILKNSTTFAELKFSSFSPFKNLRKTTKQKAYHLLFVLRILALILLILALARPQSSMKKHNVNIEGIDIVMAYDISGSMLAEDFKPNRLESARDVAINFINGRPNDRIGLVVFSGEA